MMAYLAMMAPRLVELHRVLKPTGSLYLHCDPTASHYLRMLLDGILGQQNFQNEIIWKRTSAHSGSKRWGPVHDVIFFYSKSRPVHLEPRFSETTPKNTSRAFTAIQTRRDAFEVGDLTGAGTRTGESGQAVAEISIQLNAGRHWAVPNKILLELVWKGMRVRGRFRKNWTRLDERRLIYWPAKGQCSRFKRYLEEQAGSSDC